MADSKITALTSISTSTDPANDPLVIVDVSDTSMAASGTTKKVTLNQLLGAGGTATLASATITGDLTVDTNTLKVDSTNNRVGIGTASPSNSIHLNGASGDTLFRISDSTNGVLGFIGSASGVMTGAPANSLAIRAENGLRFSGQGNAIDMTLSGGNLGLGVTPSAWGLGSSGYRAFEIGAIGNSIFSATNDLNISSNAYYLAGWKYGASSYASQYSQGSGKHIWYTAPSGTAGNAITFTQAMTLDASGRLLVGPTSANASGGVLQLSSGITFPATQVASSDANTLDDYEEGNWTPTDASGAGLTFTVSNCRYTKVGRLVTVQGSITYPATANGSNATWGGFPFNSSDSFNLGIVYTDVAVSSLTYISSNGVNAFLLTPGVNVINSTVSGKTIAFYGTYMI